MRRLCVQHDRRERPELGNPNMKNQAQTERKNSRSRGKQQQQPKLGLLSKKEERRLVTFWIPRGQSDARGQVLSKKEATRFRFVPLTEMQAMQLNNNPSGSNLRRFLRIATRDQLVQLNGATPVAWHEYLRSEPRFKLAAILDPQPAELSTFSLTSREAKSRRRLVVKEVELCGA